MKKIKMVKRANGEGTVYKRKDGRWVASITLPSGKRTHTYSHVLPSMLEDALAGLNTMLQAQ